MIRKIKVISIVVSFIFSVCFILDSCKKNGNDSDLDVAGGKIVTDGDYPGVVYLLSYYGGHKDNCTGSIISSNAVLTAAHCTKNINDKWVYKNKNDAVITQNAEANHNYIQDNENLSKDKMKENLKNDIGIWFFNGSPFKNHLKKLQLSDIDPKNLKEVRLVGWGCYTKMSTEALEKYPEYKKYTRECDKNRDEELDKRTGTNKDVFVSADASFITMYEDAVDEINGMRQSGRGINVIATIGDSGGPWLIEEGISSNKIVGIQSHGTYERFDADFCSMAYPQNTNPWKECVHFSSTAVNPVSSYNMTFLKDMVDNHKVIIPGIQIGIRVLEYNGKIKVLYKEESTSFNQNVVEHKVISKFNNNTYKTVNDLKQAWRATDFYDRSKAQWSFE